MEISVLVLLVWRPDTPETREKLTSKCAGHIIPRPGGVLLQISNMPSPTNLHYCNASSLTGEAEEVAQAIMFAISNRYVTGTTIDVDGGWLAAV
jgi:NAD(P)-dependent dehydrogenase (short-subunit alcohol dehydrogenase family)